MPGKVAFSHLLYTTSRSVHDGEIFAVNIYGIYSHIDMYNSNRNTIWNKKTETTQIIYDVTQYVWYALTSYSGNDMTLNPRKDYKWCTKRVNYNIFHWWLSRPDQYLDLVYLWPLRAHPIIPEYNGTWPASLCELKSRHGCEINNSVLKPLLHIFHCLAISELIL